MNEDLTGPVRTGKPEEAVTLTNCLFAVNTRIWMHQVQHGQMGPGQAVVDPVVLRMPGSESLYLPIFDNEDLLNETLSRMQIEVGQVMKIDDGHEWLESIPKELVVILNPRFTANGAVRFVQIQR